MGFDGVENFFWRAIIEITEKVNGLPYFSLKSWSRIS